MFTPLICHFLIGCPGSGKSTLAALLAKEGNYRIVSTDQIREALYGNASIQGDWSAIEAQVLSQIRSAIASNQPVIYDIHQNGDELVIFDQNSWFFLDGQDIQNISLGAIFQIFVAVEAQKALSVAGMVEHL
jgi:cytidylate kinase